MNELAVRDAPAPAVRAIQPQLPVPAMNDIDSWTQIVGQVVKLANEIYDTPFVPDGLRGSAAAVSACILAGREMGLGPMTSLANIDVIRGKPTQKPLLMRAMIQSRGHKWEDVEVNDTRVVVRGCRNGESTWTTATFTADQAKKAGLNLGNYPGDKLYARASSRLARRKFADVIIGIPYTPEDVEDGLDDDELGTLTESGPATPAIEPPKPRTARRRQAPSEPSPAPAAPMAAPAPPPPAQGAGEALPPLPGEEEAPDPAAAPAEIDSATPGTVTTRQITAIWTILTKEFGFGSGEAEKDRARLVCAHIVDHDLSTTTMLSVKEAGTILDTLGHWQYQAEQAGEDAAGYMLSLMMAQDAGPADGE